MPKVLSRHWFRGGPAQGFLVYYQHCGLRVDGGCVQFQFVFADWYLMIQEGDRDLCYYNDFCYRVGLWRDIPLNLTLSNVAYNIHAFIFTLSSGTWRQSYTFDVRNLKLKTEARLTPKIKILVFLVLLVWCVAIVGWVGCNVASKETGNEKRRENQFEMKCIFFVFGSVVVPGIF